MSIYTLNMMKGEHPKDSDLSELETCFIDHPEWLLSIELAGGCCRCEAFWYGLAEGDRCDGCDTPAAECEVTGIELFEQIARRDTSGRYSVREQRGKPTMILVDEDGLTVHLHGSGYEAAPVVVGGAA